jgi:hypothetical protein
MSGNRRPVVDDYTKFSRQEEKQKEAGALIDKGTIGQIKIQVSYLPGLALNLDPPHLSLPSG